MLRLAPVVPLLLTAATAEDPCKCLNWKPLYEGGFSDSAEVWCGEGREFANDTLTLEHAFLAELDHHGQEAADICDTYRKMSDNFCVNSAIYIYGAATEKEKRQWCYVSSECKDLNGGRVVSEKENVPTFLPTWVYKYIGEQGYEVYKFIKQYLHSPKVLKRDVAVKYCGAGDKRTRDMPVAEVAALATKYKVRMDYMMKFAYAMARDRRLGTMEQFRPLWEDVRDYLTPEKKDQLPKNVLQAMENKDPIILDTDAHHSDDSIRVIAGNEIHKVDSPCEEEKKHHKHCGPKTAEQFKYRRGDDVGAFKGTAKKASATSGNTEL